MSSHQSYTQSWSHSNGTSVSIQSTTPPFKSTLALPGHWRPSESRNVAMTAESGQSREDKSRVEEGGSVSISR